jgi:hypothetical protein
MHFCRVWRSDGMLVMCPGAGSHRENTEASVDSRNCYSCGAEGEDLDLHRHFQDPRAEVFALFRPASNMSNCSFI